MSAAFAPRVAVLSRQSLELAPPDLSLDAILRRFPDLAAAEAICLSGSIVVGWGNVYSDLDIFAFSDRELELPVDDSAEVWPGRDPSGLRWNRWIGRFGDTRADLTVLPTDAMDVALAPYLGAAEPEFCGATDEIQDFIYRVSVAEPLTGRAHVRRFQELIGRSTYHRALARTLKVKAENSLTDLAGQLDAGDDLTARISAMHAAANLVDACLIAAGELCRGPKWVLRRLDTASECGIGADEYRTEVLEGAREGESHADCARRVARWCQSHLVRLDGDVLLPVVPSMPALDHKQRS